MSIQVRPFEFKDLDAVVDMAAEFFAESPYVGLADFQQDSVLQMIEMCSNGHVILVATKGDSYVGMAGAMIAPSMFNASFLIAQELVIYVRKQNRKGTVGYRLLKSLEKECKNKGADALEISGINGLSPDSFPGYTPNEQRFMRVF